MSVNTAKSESARRVLGLLSGSFGIEGDVDELLGYGLRVVIVAAGLNSLLVFIYSFRPIALGVVGVAAFDVRPGFDPLGLAADAINRRLEIVERQLPVLLFEVNQAQVVIDPGVVTIELQRCFQLLLRLGVLAFLEQFDTATRHDRNLQLVGNAQDFVVGIDLGVNRLAV